MNLPTLFDLSLKNRAGEVALESGDRTLTFGELDQRRNRMARLLAPSVLYLVPRRLFPG